MFPFDSVDEEEAKAAQQQYPTSSRWLYFDRAWLAGANTGQLNRTPGCLSHRGHWLILWDAWGWQQRGESPRLFLLHAAALLSSNLRHYKTSNQLRAASTGHWQLALTRSDHVCVCGLDDKLAPL